MTTNKPATYWASSAVLAKLESRHNNSPCVLTDGPAEFNDVALIRLSDYERLQADHERLQVECEKLRRQRDDMAMYKMAARQLIGIPASVGVCEPAEGFVESPGEIMPAVRDMALRIELLESQLAESEALLAESLANDQQAMAYLSEVRAIVGGNDFPDTVRRCEKLRKDAERYRWMCDGNGYFLEHEMLCGFENEKAEADAAIDAAMQGSKP